MNFLSRSEVVFIIYFLLMYYSVVWLTLTKDEHYTFRIRVNKMIRSLFFLFSSRIKHDTIPVVSLTTVIEVLITFPILIIIKLINNNFDLKYTLVNYLFVPWFCLSFLIIFIDLGFNSIKRKKALKKEKVEKQIYLDQKHAEIKRKRKKHKQF